jgi:hypothetical protein
LDKQTNKAGLPVVLGQKNKIQLLIKNRLLSGLAVFFGEGRDPEILLINLFLMHLRILLWFAL